MLFRGGSPEAALQRGGRPHGGHQRLRAGSRPGSSNLGSLRGDRSPSLLAALVGGGPGSALPDHVDHQHLPVLRNDVRVRANRDHREGAEHH